MKIFIRNTISFQLQESILRMDVMVSCLELYIHVSVLYLSNRVYYLTQSIWQSVPVILDPERSVVPVRNAGKKISNLEQRVSGSTASFLNNYHLSIQSLRKEHFFKS